MSNEEPEKLKIVVIDNGKWPCKYLDYEITNNNPNADVSNKIPCKDTDSLKQILDSIPKPDELETDEFGNVLNKTMVWIPFTYEEFTARNMDEEYLALRDQYPHLNINFPYRATTRPWLHSHAKNHKVVDQKAELDDKGESIVPAPVGDLGAEKGKKKTK